MGRKRSHLPTLLSRDLSALRKIATTTAIATAQMSQPGAVVVQSFAGTGQTALILSLDEEVAVFVLSPGPQHASSVQQYSAKLDQVVTAFLVNPRQTANIYVGTAGKTVHALAFKPGGDNRCSQPAALAEFARAPHTVDKRVSWMSACPDDPETLVLLTRGGSIMAAHLPALDNMTCMLRHVALVTCASFVGADLLATGDRDGRIRISRFPQAFVVERFLMWHEDVVCGMVAVGTRHLVSSSLDGALVLWDVVHGKRIAETRLGRGVQAMVFDGHHAQLVLAQEHSAVLEFFAMQPSTLAFPAVPDFRMVLSVEIFGLHLVDRERLLVLGLVPETSTLCIVEVDLPSRHIVAANVSAVVAASNEYLASKHIDRSALAWVSIDGRARYDETSGAKLPPLKEMELLRQ